MRPGTAVTGISFPSIVEEIRRGGLTSAEIGRIARVRERQVQNWAAGTSRLLQSFVIVLLTFTTLLGNSNRSTDQRG